MPGLMTFERDLALHRLRLLGHPDDAHAPFADLLQELVGPDHRAGPIGRRLIDRGAADGRESVQEVAGFGVGLEQHLDVAAQRRVSSTGVVEVRSRRVRRLVSATLPEKLSFVALSDSSSHAVSWRASSSDSAPLRERPN